MLTFLIFLTPNNTTRQDCSPSTVWPIFGKYITGMYMVILKIPDFDVSFVMTILFSFRDHGLNVFRHALA